MDQEMIERFDESGFYDEDDIMAQFGRTIIDQYIGWIKKYGEPDAGTGWASFAKATIDNFIQEGADRE